jgi:hypothetical protein
MIKCNRRKFLGQSLAIGSAVCLSGKGTQGMENSGAYARRFNLSVSVDALEADPGLLDIVRDAGIENVWLACFFHGGWHNTPEDLKEWGIRIGKMGMGTRQITVPLGHPSFTDQTPEYSAPVAHTGWKKGIRPDGKAHWGVSIHPPATKQNVEAMKRIKVSDPKIVFLDDDFRLAPSPNDIGGCFCDEHQNAFLKRHGYGDEKWAELLQAVADRRLTPVMRSWVEDTCDELSGSFFQQQEAARPEMDLGIMVMYLGSEKAGIRLKDYTDVPFRVGELMFNDKSFAPVKGKTNELFSSLFHRRFVEPERAYSETTAWPPDGLSAPNMAAKLAVSTISDVRNTMFMSGITPFPRTHWETLAPAMRKQAEFHRHLAGHRPAGPFKHYWGEHSRWVGDSNPYSLFLAAGIPFEVTEDPASDGWTFLSDADARAVADGSLRSNGTVFVSRKKSEAGASGVRPVEELLSDLYALKKKILPQLDEAVPYVEQDTPVVCAWYPTAKCVLLWNLTEEAQDLTVKRKGEQREVKLGGLDSALLVDIV